MSVDYYSHTIYSNVKISVCKNEICPLCMNDFIDTKNIVVPDCGHSMHINCFCQLYDHKLINCSICNLQIIERKSRGSCTSAPVYVPEHVPVLPPSPSMVSMTVPTPAPAPTPARTSAMSPTYVRSLHSPHWDRLEVSRVYPVID